LAESMPSAVNASAKVVRASKSDAGITRLSTLWVNGQLGACSYSVRMAVWRDEAARGPAIHDRGVGSYRSTH
jgi:hypothetical protein